MCRSSFFAAAIAIALGLDIFASAQVLGPHKSLAAQLLQLDCNGDGRIDDRERAATQPKVQEDEQPEGSQLPLICEGEAHGLGAGGGGSAAAQSTQRAASQIRIQPRWVVQRIDQRRVVAPEGVRTMDENVQQEQSSEPAAGGYPETEQQPVEPEMPQRSVGLNKAVQYRLLQNRRIVQPRPVQYRQAAVFGATQGLVKREPTRYRPAAVAVSCCGPCRVSFVTNPGAY